MMPRSPTSSMWKRLAPPSTLEQRATAWKRGSLRVISAVDMMTSPVDKTPTPTWHVSVSAVGGRVSDVELVVVRRAFGMEDAEEDNHEPGQARHLFLSIDPAHRAPCECNTAEATFVEGDGHTWKAPPGDELRRRVAMSALWPTRTP